MNESRLNRRLVVGGALALAGGAAHAAARALPRPAVTVIEHGVGTGSAWRSMAEFEAFRVRYVDAGRVRFVVRGDKPTHLAVSRKGFETTRISDSATLHGAIETALAA
jgi:hypothetical protein